MFELERAIQDWRNGLLQSQSILESDVDELESHVRDEVDSLMLAGLSTEEAFMVSIHRTGDIETVGQEFAKVNPSLAWRRRVFWMLFGVLVSMVISGIAAVCSQGTATLLTRLHVNVYGAGIASIMIHIGVFMVFFFAVIFGAGLVAKSIKSRISMSLALLLSIVSIFILKTVSLGISIVQARIFGPEILGQLALARNYAGLGWNILWPLIVVVMLFVLWSSRPQHVR